MARHALLVGYYGYMNAGDDAFVLVSDWALRSYLGVERLSLYAETSLAFAPSLRPIFHPALWRPALKAMRQAHALARTVGVPHVVFGGGSVFQNDEPNRDYLVFLNCAGPGPHFATGVSIGPFRTAAAERSCARILRRLEFVGVRDRISMERARALAPRTRVEQTFDLGVLLDRASCLHSGLPGRRRGLGIALCNYERFSGGPVAEESRRIRVTVETVRAIAAEGLNDEVVLLEFNGHPRFGDRQVNAALREGLTPHVALREVRYDSDPVGLYREVAGLGCLLAMRLHASVFGYCTGTPVLNLAYHEKCMEWASRIGAGEELVLPTRELSGRRLEEALRRLILQPSPPALPLSVAVSQALRNWSWLRDGSR